MVSPAGGRVFGPYRLVRSIAADAVTTTYAAITDGGEAARGRGGQYLVRIAGKVDPGDAVADELVREFLAASQRAGAINHPSIIRPHDLGVIDDRPYVATPFVRAVPLGDMLTHGGAINEATALALFAQLAAALDVGHRADIVHGALSPRTIWVGPSTSRGAAYVGYLTGFGTGLLLRAHLQQQPRGAPVDDVLYVAPEQLRGEPAGHASDQYSLACALYHTLVGEPPFERSSRSKLFGAHLMAPAPGLAPHEVRALTTGVALQRAMSKQPADRFDTCGLLINAALPEPATRAAGRGAFSRPAAVSGRPVAAGRVMARPAWTLVVGGVGLVLAALVLWLLLRPSDTTPSAGDDAVAARPVAATQSAGASAAAGMSPRWSATVADAPITVLAVTDDVIVAAGDDGRMAGVRPAAGRIGWRADAEDVRAVAVGGAAVISTGDALAALDIGDGSQRWRVDDAALDALRVTADAAIGAHRTAAGLEVRAVALDDGRQRWRTPVPSGGAGPVTVDSDGGAFVYALHGDTLFAVDQTGPTTTIDGGSEQVATPVWQVDVADAWPVLAPTATGVTVATGDGQVCFHARRGGAVRWCEPVPGSDTEQPVLQWTRRGLVVATPRSVAVVDRETGVPLWSVSPGSVGGLLAASNAVVMVGDPSGGTRVLDAATGDDVLVVSSPGDVTAFAAHERWVLIGTADGQVHRFDLDATR